jgi:hypothetical protein
VSRSKGRRPHGPAQRPRVTPRRPVEERPASEPAEPDPEPTPPATATSRALSPTTARVLELSLQGAGLVVALALAVIVAIYGAFLTPYRIGTTLVPVSLLIGVVGNFACIWLAYYVTRRRLISLLPGAVWIIITFLASMRTHEGDLLLISSDWVASAYLLAGPTGIAVAAYVLFRPRS